MEKEFYVSPEVEEVLLAGAQALLEGSNLEDYEDDGIITGW